MKDHNERPCQLIEKWISFEELDWGNWILATNSHRKNSSKDGKFGFYFNTCEGVCPFPMPAHIGNENILQWAVCFFLMISYSVICLL